MGSEREIGTTSRKIPREPGSRKRVLVPIVVHRMKRLGFLVLVGLGGLPVSDGAEPAKATPAAPPPAAATTDELYQIGKQLFDEYAPPEVKQEYEFPSKTEWDAFARRLQQALEGGSLPELAAYEDEARTALLALHAFPEYSDYANWLAERLDYIEAARQLAPAPITPPKTVPSTPPPKPAPAAIPFYDLWRQRVQDRPVPTQAAALMPKLKAAFAAEGVPVELIWIAEAESGFDPGVRSPAGARGLFQLMPSTARNLGLSTLLPDERTDPTKSARAAARYLRELHEKFGTWPLALAAYNAGEGRVRRALATSRTRDFAGVASLLPSETRMYVPKICALVALRTGMAPDKIPPPQPAPG